MAEIFELHDRARSRCSPITAASRIRATPLHARTAGRGRALDRHPRARRRRGRARDRRRRDRHPGGRQRPHPRRAHRASSRAGRRRCRSTGWVIPAPWARPTTTTSSPTSGSSRPAPSTITRRRSCACPATSRTTASARSPPAPDPRRGRACPTTPSSSAASTARRRSPASPSSAGWRSCSASPGSVLWLLETAAEHRARCGDYAEAARHRPRAAGVRAEASRTRSHLARYPLADLFLDTAPYGAHTTASDALWMGVPVLTLSGRGFASRVCGSLVRSAGLPELVCENAARLRGARRGAGWRPGPRRRAEGPAGGHRDTCDLFNMEKLVASLEGLYADMARTTRGRLPQPDLPNLDAYFKIGCDFDHEAARCWGSPTMPASTARRSSSATWSGR